MISTNFSSDIAKTLHELGAHDILQMEQYMDFVRCRYFRKTLICRSSIPLNRSINSRVVGELNLASNAAPESAEAPLDPSQRVTYQTSGGGSLTCRSPLTKLALRALQQAWPMPVAFENLLAECRSDAAREGFPTDDATASESLSGDMLTALGAGVVEWRVTPVSYTTTIGERPATTAWARLQSAQGYKAVNLRGELITLDEIHRQTLKHLDGNRSVAQVIDLLVAGLRSGDFVLHPENDKTVITEEEQMRRLLQSAIGKVLENLARQAFISAHLN
jgi:methyltransferase-like protein